jgi:prepilin-type processing-associated H-X9-DG protein
MNANRSSGSHGGAFTLVELLVVTGMVALGALMLAPALARTSVRNPALQCMSNLQQLQRAHAMYAEDNSGRLVQNLGSSSQDLGNWAAGWMDWASGSPTGANTNPQYLTNAALGPYTARAVRIYKCPADKFPSQIGPRLRSYSINGFVGGTTEQTLYGYTTYRIFLKDSDFTAPGPAKTCVFADEHPDSINDGLLGMLMPAAGSWPTYTTWEDVPASYHNGAGAFSFADGHVEVHKWLDKNTLRPVLMIEPSAATGTTSPNDNRWLVSRASAPK